VKKTSNANISSSIDEIAILNHIVVENLELSTNLLTEIISLSSLINHVINDSNARDRLKTVFSRVNADTKAVAKNVSSITQETINALINIESEFELETAETMLETVRSRIRKRDKYDRKIEILRYQCY
jgi:hypothetical protein